jgi:methionyl-tRNA synthetase
MYVWFEAVMGYFTASVEWARNTDQPDAWKKWWYNPDAKIYNFIGKDNIEFHTIIWPAELMGIDGLYAVDGDGPVSLPYDVPANEFMNIEGQQFSKSRNWAVWIPDLLERYDPDPIRYYVAMTRQRRATRLRVGRLRQPGERRTAGRVAIWSTGCCRLPTSASTAERRAMTVDRAGSGDHRAQRSAFEQVGASLKG